jgi:hypothetical protein
MSLILLNKKIFIINEKSKSNKTDALIVVKIVSLLSRNEKNIIIKFIRQKALEYTNKSNI